MNSQLKTKILVASLEVTLIWVWEKIEYARCSLYLLYDCAFLNNMEFFIEFNIILRFFAPKT